MIDLSTIRAQARTISAVIDRSVPEGGFLSVSDWSSATDAIANASAEPPALYITLSREQAEKNRLASGGRAQRVNSTISALFCLGAERADDERSDPVEIARGAIIANLIGFKPGGALIGLSYLSYALRSEGDGFIWGEVLFTTSWDLRGNA